MKLRRKIILKFLAKCCWQKMLTVFFVFTTWNTVFAQQNANSDSTILHPQSATKGNLEAKLGIRISNDAQCC